MSFKEHVSQIKFIDLLYISYIKIVDLVSKSCQN